MGKDKYGKLLTQETIQSLGFFRDIVYLQCSYRMSHHSRKRAPTEDSDQKVYTNIALDTVCVRAACVRACVCV